MARADILHSLLTMLGPLSPFESPEERETQESSWISTLDPSSVDDLVDLVLCPPSPNELGRISESAFEYEVSHVLAQIGARDPGYWLPRLGPLLSTRATRPTVIEVMGTIGVAQGLAWLAPLVEAADLSEDEAARLACALGEIGVGDAKTLLELLRDRTSPDHVAIHQEIQIALDAIARSAR